MSRNLNDWEVEYENLMKNISDFQIGSDPDQVLWRGCKNSEFSMSSYYCKLMAHSQSNSSIFPSNLIWKNSAPPRMAFFAWEAYRESILTLDKLRARDCTLLNGCFMCMRDKEDHRHLLLRCPTAYELWSLVYGLLGICWVPAGSIEDEIWALGGVGLKIEIV